MSETSPLNTFLLGLGLFFLGLQLVGQNLRVLSGGSFRNMVKAATHTPILAGLLGVIAGALMQSATAVTFILVSMVGSGIIRTAPARMVVVWCNVGLTALAFLATLNIHPFIALLVGGAGIAMGSVRARPWNTIAGALLGIGLILFALDQLSKGAAPLKDAEWFRSGIGFAVGSPVVGFLCGIAAAALLQSNTGAAMLIITLAGAGALTLEQAMPILYGTNLGAIILRGFLAMGLRGDSLRLVRMEDLFCVVSGVLMMGLFFAEALGLPLVRAMVEALGSGIGQQLALVFLISNFLPALVITPLLPLCAGLLKGLWPNDPVPAPGEPAYLSTQAVGDPASALDLIPRELGRLIGSLSLEPRVSEDPENHTPPSFVSLASKIERFCARVASENRLSDWESLRLQRLRAWLHTIRHIGEAVGEFADVLAGLTPEEMRVAEGYRGWLQKHLSLAAAATATLAKDDVETFYESSKAHGPEAEAVRGQFATAAKDCGASCRLALSALSDDFDIAAWLIHRLSKLERNVVVNPG